MMAWPGKPRCPVTCLEKYFVKREPQCDALWQKPQNHNASSFSGSATDLWEITSLKICSQICARKLVWHKCILLIA